mgnify:CR=1 FL=1
MSDLTIAATPGILVIFTVQTIIPAGTTIAGHSIEFLTLPLVALGIGGGTLLVYLTPSYIPTMNWFLSMIGFYGGARRSEHAEACRQTQIKRIHPNSGAIERTDGTLLGMVQVMPPTMALATEDEWAEKATALQEFLNTAVDHPIQIFSTTRDFPTNRYLSRYEDRLTDPDVKSNPRLQELIERYIAWYQDELDRRHMTIREHFVVVPISPKEVHFEYGSIIEKLARIPIIELVISTVFSPNKLDVRIEMVDSLSHRLQRVESGLRDIDGCSARRLSAEESASIIRRFWDREVASDGIQPGQIPRQPIISGEIR